jgi:hypothetical protein
LTTERARISWKVIPANSGVPKVRVVTGSAENSAFRAVVASLTVSFSLSQRMAASSA